MSFYNIGAGGFSHPDWVNVDLKSDHYARIQPAGFIPYDLMDCAPLPIETGTAELIYCSHTIEHVPMLPVRNLLAEAHRVMRRGAVLRLVTPCAELIYRAYRNGDREFFSDLGKREGKPGLSMHEYFLDLFGSQLCATNPTPGPKWSDGDVGQLIDSRSRDMALDAIGRACTFNHAHPGNHVNWFSYDKLASALHQSGFRTVYRSGVGQSSAPQMRDLAKFDPYFAISLYVEAVR